MTRRFGEGFIVWEVLDALDGRTPVDPIEIEQWQLNMAAFTALVATAAAKGAPDPARIALMREKGLSEQGIAKYRAAVLDARRSREAFLQLTHAERVALVRASLPATIPAPLTLGLIEATLVTACGVSLTELRELAAESRGAGGCA